MMLWEICFAEERDSLVMNRQDIVLEVDAGLEAFQHVQAKKNVDVLALHDGEGAREKHGSDLELHGVHTPEDVGSTHAFSDSAPPAIDQTHYITGGCALGRHDGNLSARVDERFDLVTVDFDRDIQHRYTAEG
jgi:hypothetical protein